jgi:hypothetical protein
MGAQCNTCETIRVRDGERIRGVKKEYHVRKQGGRVVAYILCDNVAQKYVLLSQKLSHLATYISNCVNDESVSVSALFKIIPEGRRAKCRWAIEQVDLESAPDRFEAVRRQYRNSVVLGSPECYQIS